MKIYNLNQQTMKTSIKKATLGIALLSSIFGATAQITVADFETFTLAPSSAYNPTTSASSPFTTVNGSFQHLYDANFDYWSGGFAYTNINDSVTGSFMNLYGVRAYKGYTNSATYVVGQDRAVIKTTTIPQTTVNGFYMTNTTYAYKSMAKGDLFTRKFGDTTGTGSGTIIPQGSYPDFFKVIVKGYKNGSLKNDSVTVMLADFTFTNNTQDYILSTWQWVNTSALGTVDSIKFFMRSSDEGDFGINTPLFFAIDNFSTGDYIYTTLIENFSNNLSALVYPNPFNTSLNIELGDNSEKYSSVTLKDVTGKFILKQQFQQATTLVDLAELHSGIYLMEIILGENKSVKKLIKN